MNGLSKRELEVLRCVMAGYKTKEIADELGVSRRTVDVHRAHILAKFGLRQTDLRNYLLSWFKETKDDASTLPALREPSVSGERV